MDMISSFDIQRVKDASSIVDVIGDFYSLRKDGTGYTCLCPFHEDRHLGSFKISPRRNIYTCFSCGESGTPVDFLMKHEGLTFPDAIRWLAAKYGIQVEGSESFKPKRSQPHTPPPPLPMLVLPHSHVIRRADTSQDTLCNWLRTLPWNTEQQARVEQTIRNYMVGHSKDGHTIFWQMDENGRLRTGKMMRYKPDGHRDRESHGNFSWIHTRLEQAGMIDLDSYEVQTCLFGLHQLDYCPHATVNIVESEKTAIICAIAYGNYERQLWMASGGLNFLTAERLKPIMQRGRHIVLYPDHDGIDRWTEAAQRIDYKHLYVNSDFIREHWEERDGQKADLADILIRMMDDAQRTGLQTVGQAVQSYIEKNPALETLINNFNLIET